MNAELSLQQAPPLSVPLRFFLTAPLFGIAAAVLLLWLGPDALASRWTPGALALSHLVALGVLGLVMAGALLQLLPVLVGVPVPRPRLLGGLCHGSSTLGIICLVAGFLRHDPFAFRAALLLLGLGFGLLLLIAAHSLARAPQQGDSVRGMRWAAASLALTVTLGLLLAAGHAGLGLPLWRHALTDLHLAWGLLGWILLLVAAVAYQVVPMFQMTAAYPPWLRRWFAPVVALLLLAWSAAGLLGGSRPGLLSTIPATLLAVAAALFAVLTLRLLARRRRKVGDATLAFWRLGMAALLAAAVSAACWPWLPIAAGSALALLPALLLLGFALSVVNGMLYKIVPFLVWLHLQQQLSNAPKPRAALLPPNMKQILPDARLWPQFALHAAALLCLLAGLAWPPLLRLAALLWLGSFVLLEWNLLDATRCYLAERRRIAAALADT
jgi:hypothetical protein